MTNCFKFRLLMLILAINTGVFIQASLCSEAYDWSGLISVEGSQYILARDKLCKNLQSNDAMRKMSRPKTNDWQSCLLYAIACERVTNLATIAELVSWKPDVSYASNAVTRIEETGKELSRKAKDIPLFLVESIWKTNELAIFTNRCEHIAACLHAIGILKIQDGRLPAERLLMHENEMVRTYAATALGELGHPASARILLESVIRGYQGKPDGSLKAAVEAMFVCGGTEIVPLLEDALEKAERGAIKDPDQSLRLFLEVRLLSLKDGR